LARRGLRRGQSPEMRREEKKSASANGTIRQEVLAELEKTRNLFELNDLQPVHGYSWTDSREDARCR
jgi:hypothetical protein